MKQDTRDQPADPTLDRPGSHRRPERLERAPLQRAEPIDFAALVHRGDVFRRARATALSCALLVLAILLAYAASGHGALLATVCLLASAAIGATYVATRLANAPLPRVRR